MRMIKIGLACIAAWLTIALVAADSGRCTWVIKAIGGGGTTCSGDYGNTGTAGSSLIVGNLVAYCNRVAFSCGANATATVRARCQRSGGTYMYFKTALYEDDGGEPGDLIASASSSSNCPTSIAWVSNSLTVNDTSNSEYRWLCFLNADNAAGYYDTTGSSGGTLRYDTFGSFSWPSTWDTAGDTSGTTSYSMYITF